MASSPASKCTCSYIPPKNLQPLTLKGAKPNTPEAIQASKLEYKTVTKVYAFNGIVVKHS
jgi:hypothetical protein